MSATVDTQHPDTLRHTQQDVAHPSSAPTPSSCRWYVVASKPHAERRAHAALHLKGYQPYLPLITVRLPNRHYHTRPLFQGYLFIQLDLAHPWYPIKYAPGVFGLLCTNGIPTPCPPGAVEAIQAAESERALSLYPEWPKWAPGTPCVVANTMFDDVPAVVLKVGKEMALVSMMMLGHLREVTVGLDSLQPRLG